MNRSLFNTIPHRASKDEWLTPPYIIEALGDFDLDPCAPPAVKRPWSTAAEHISLPEDGLRAEWKGRVWLNPPYGRETFKWLEKLADHGSGTALIFARTETVGFHEQVWQRADAVFFFRGRLAFHHSSGRKARVANAPSVLISYSKADTRAIEKAWENGLLQGEIIQLHNFI